jgi:hypothetical protein
MTETEINKVIAEYMGEHIVGTHDCPECGEDFLTTMSDKGSIWGTKNYVKSLDALIPVVSKLVEDTPYAFELNINRGGSWYYRVNVWDLYKMTVQWMYEFDSEGFFKSPSTSLATACAKVIKEDKCNT